MSFTPYTTPTPLPNRPNWNKTDWVEYFADNHPNIWFREQQEKKKTLNKDNSSEAQPDHLDKEERKTFNIIVEKEENDSSDSGITWTIDTSEDQESFINGLKLELEKHNKTEKDTASMSPKLSSKFFEDPLNPKPEEWLDWPPEKWIEWSEKAAFSG